MNINNLEENWDVVIIGGGITGAGILREAVGMGLRGLLVEQKDFAWGLQVDRQSSFMEDCAIFNTGICS